MGTSLVLQHHFTGVRTVSPTAGLDRVVKCIPKFSYITVFLKIRNIISKNILKIKSYTLCSFNKMLVRMANREDHDQTASSEAV